MSPQTKAIGTPTEIDPLYLLTELVKMQQSQTAHAAILETLKENLDGTMRTKGLREKIAVAEQDIQSNKTAFIRMEQNFTEFRASMEANLTENFQEIRNMITAKTDSIIAETNANKTSIQKIQPFINAFAWIMSVIGPIVIGMILSGRWFFGSAP